MTKICNKCKQEKSISEFHRRKDKWQPYCKVCKKLDDANYRLANLSYFRERAKKQRQEIRSLIQELKSVPCMKCQNNFHFSAMDFHHREDEKKETEVSNLARFNNKKKLLAEIAKCDIICSNCHRIQHWYENAN